MILAIVKSINDVPIRLTDERWYEHIVFNRPYLSGYLQPVIDAVENPQFILRDHNKSKVAVINLGRKKWLHVVYRELSKTDGFIITATIETDYNGNLVIWTPKY